jgi:hypothetical protein
MKLRPTNSYRISGTTTWSLEVAELGVVLALVSLSALALIALWGRQWLRAR